MQNRSEINGFLEAEVMMR